jgi:hypothetical protein
VQFLSSYLLFYFRLFFFKIPISGCTLRNFLSSHLSLQTLVPSHCRMWLYPSSFLQGIHLYQCFPSSPSASRCQSSTIQYLFFPQMCKCLCTFLFPIYFSVHYIMLLSTTFSFLFVLPNSLTQDPFAAVLGTPNILLQNISWTFSVSFHASFLYNIH